MGAERCHNCGGPVEERDVLETTTLDGVEFIDPVRATCCTGSCGKAGRVCWSADLAAWERKIARQIVARVEPPGPEMHRFVRHTYGISAEHFHWLARHMGVMAHPIAPGDCYVGMQIVKERA